MASTTPGARTARALLALLAAGAALGGCGGSSSTTKPTQLALSIAEQGKTAKFTVPASPKGGLTHVAFTNSGKQPHGAQLILVTGGHTAAEAVKILTSGQNPKIPNWMRGEGGVGTTLPGQTLTATVNLPKGTYAVVDTASLGNGPPPAYTQLKLSGGTRGAIKPLPARIIGTQTGKDRYAWHIAGLRSGANTVEFTSKGKRAIHLAVAVKLKAGANPSTAQLEKGLQSNGPPSFADLRGQPADTAALDGGKSLTTTLRFTPGRYVVFCPLADRNGGKPHFLQGMVAKVNIP